MALTFLLRQMAGQLIEDGQVQEARGFVDILETLQLKTKGNVGSEEEKLFESVLYELRMAVVRGKDKEKSESTESAESAEGAESTESAESAEGAAADSSPSEEPQESSEVEKGE
jgi:hypothetical protein